jgi:hypothetical protein
MIIGQAGPQKEFTSIFLSARRERDLKFIQA